MVVGRYWGQTLEVVAKGLALFLFEQEASPWNKEVLR